MQQGRCVFSPDGSGRILDGLAGLEKVITPAVVGQVLWATNRVNQRACKLTHEVMLWVVLAMGILTDLPIRQVFKHAPRFRMGEDAPQRSSLRVARQRLGIHPIRHLFEEIVHPLANPDTPGAFYRGLRLIGSPSRVVFRSRRVACRRATPARNSPFKSGVNRFCGNWAESASSRVATASILVSSNKRCPSGPKNDPNTAIHPR